ncbi:MAG: hypothetical protein ACK51Z_08420, partial [Pseudomonadota bacterium]
MQRSPLAPGPRRGAAPAALAAAVLALWLVAPAPPAAAEPGTGASDAHPAGLDPLGGLAPRSQSALR